MLVGLPSDIRQFPTIRTGAEIASQRATFAAMNVTVNADCDASPNFIFVRGKVVTAVATGAQRAATGLGPVDLSCADAPNTQDFVLTTADITFINTLLAQMNTEIAAQANARGYALFSLESLYATSKDGVPFNLQTFLGSPTPYGPKISLDGVHPSPEGHRILANAAISALQPALRLQDHRDRAIAGFALPPVHAGAEFSAPARFFIERARVGNRAGACGRQQELYAGLPRVRRRVVLVATLLGHQARQPDQPQPTVVRAVVVLARLVVLSAVLSVARRCTGGRKESNCEKRRRDRPAEFDALHLCPLS